MHLCLAAEHAMLPILCFVFLGSDSDYLRNPREGDVPEWRLGSSQQEQEYSAITLLRELDRPREVRGGWWGGGFCSSLICLLLPAATHLAV